MTDTDLIRRAETAKRNDDSDLLGRSLETPRFQSRSGGDIQADIGTQAHEGMTKQDDINHGEREPVSPVLGRR